MRCSGGRGSRSRNGGWGRHGCGDGGHCCRRGGRVGGDKGGRCGGEGGGLRDSLRVRNGSRASCDDRDDTDSGLLSDNVGERESRLGHAVLAEAGRGAGLRHGVLQTASGLPGLALDACALARASISVDRAESALVERAATALHASRDDHIVSDGVWRARD